MDPILSEVLQTKEALAREAGCDVRRFFSGLRKWSAEHVHVGQVVRSAAELRQAYSESHLLRDEAEKKHGRS